MIECKWYIALGRQLSKVDHFKVAFDLFLDSVLDVPQFVVSPRGHLVDRRGYIFSKERTIKNYIYWECTNRSVKRTKCSARVSTIDSKIVIHAQIESSQIKIFGQI